MSKYIDVRQLIMISSVKDFREYGCNLKPVRYTQLYKLIPAFILKWSNRLTADYFFGIESKEEPHLLSAIIERSMVWAIAKIMNWKNTGHSKHKILHLHGDSDRVFTNSHMENVIWINPDHALELSYEG